MATATLLKIAKEKEKEMMTSGMSPEEIRNKLFYFHQAAHVFHHDTTDGWEHDALGKLYTDLIDFKDDIPEKIMGYMGGKRISGFKSLPVPEYTSGCAMTLAKEIIDFAKKLEEYAEEKEYCDISNMAQSLSGLGAKTVYRLTLK